MTVRSGLSYATKKEIQEMVSSALRPLYKNKEINSVQYTEINRDVSRMLYDKMGGIGGDLDEKRKDDWEQVAAIEVRNAVAGMKEKFGAAMT